MHHSALQNHFDIHGAQYHIMILNHRINILPYRYVSQIPIVKQIFIQGYYVI